MREDRAAPDAREPDFASSERKMRWKYLKAAETKDVKVWAYVGYIKLKISLTEREERKDFKGPIILQP